MPNDSTPPTTTTKQRTRHERRPLPDRTAPGWPTDLAHVIDTPIGFRPANDVEPSRPGAA